LERNLRNDAVEEIFSINILMMDTLQGDPS
jgi:hypothetical protein